MHAETQSSRPMMMRNVFYIAVLVILLYSAMAQAESPAQPPAPFPAYAGPPHYFLLRENRTTIGHPYAATVTPVTRYSYAYGYFGAQPKPHYTIRGSYSNNYTRAIHYGSW